MKRSAVLLCLFVLMGARDAWAQDDSPSGEYIAGLTLASAGAVGGLITGFGAFTHIVKREYAGGWGWLAMISGAATIGGGVLIADGDPDAHLAGGLTAGLGVLALATGIVGLSLETPETKARRRDDWAIVPTLLLPGRTRRSTAVGISGVF